VRQNADDHLECHEPDDQTERDGQVAAVGVGAQVMGMPAVMMMMVMTAVIMLMAMIVDGATRRRPARESVIDAQFTPVPSI
jgi:hypothetical protein